MTQRRLRPSGSSGLRIVRDPSPREIEIHGDIIAPPSDVPIVVAAISAATDYLLTFNRRPFTDDPGVAARSGLRIGTPGDARLWVRGQLTHEGE